MYPHWLVWTEKELPWSIMLITRFTRVTLVLSAQDDFRIQWTTDKLTFFQLTEQLIWGVITIFHKKSKFNSNGIRDWIRLIFGWLRDWVEIRLHDDNQKMCGYIPDNKYYNDTNIVIEFNSDAKINEMGFWIQYNGKYPGIISLLINSFETLWD